MKPVTVWIDIDASREAVWAEISDFASHAAWMSDVESIGFESESDTGVGTRLRVETRVGPLRTTDLMLVTRWEEGRTIGVQHTGLVSGTGRFELSPLAGATRVVWREELAFPPMAGGPVTGFFARPVLIRIWRRNLHRLRARILSG